jgi:hypothetical protein
MALGCDDVRTPEWLRQAGWLTGQLRMGTYQ